MPFYRHRKTTLRFCNYCNRIYPLQTVTLSKKDANADALNVKKRWLNLQKAAMFLLIYSKVDNAVSFIKKLPKRICICDFENCKSALQSKGNELWIPWPCRIFCSQQRYRLKGMKHLIFAWPVQTLDLFSNWVPAFFFHSLEPTDRCQELDLRRATKLISCVHCYWKRDGTGRYRVQRSHDTPKRRSMKELICAWTVRALEKSKSKQILRLCRHRKLLSGCTDFHTTHKRGGHRDDNDKKKKSKAFTFIWSHFWVA